jgi:hypothetical protein
MTNVESIITKFLSAPPLKEGAVDPINNLIYYHKGEKYQYMILVNLVDKNVQISGDYDSPFGARSLFESYANYETAAIEFEKGYGDRMQLVFRDLKNNILIMVMMWDNKDLSVWRYA